MSTTNRSRRVVKARTTTADLVEDIESTASSANESLSNGQVRLT